MNFLKGCDNIKLNYIMKIQNVGCFCVLNLKEKFITHYSENILTTIGDKIDSIIKNNDILIDINNFLDSGDVNKTYYTKWEYINIDISKSQFLLSECIIECEVTDNNVYITISNLNQRLNTNILPDIVSNITQKTVLNEILEVSALSLCELLKSDRVMIYKFDEEFNGMVIFEKTFGYVNMTSYKGLLFPSEDIPLSARELYKKNKVRFIYNVNEDEINITGKTNIDMTNCFIRGVAKPHIEYMKNMGVISSISIALIVNNKLWGLLVYHYYSKPVIIPDKQILDICKTIGTISSFKIEHTDLKHQYEVYECLKNLTSTSISNSSTNLILQDVANISVTILNLFCVLYYENINHTITNLYIGEDILTSDLCSKIVNEILEKHNTYNENNIYDTELKLEDTYFRVASFYRNNQLLLFIRKSIIKEINWAGDPDEPKKYSNEFLHPRKSFQTFIEKRKKHPECWSDKDIISLNTIGKYILEIFEQKEINIIKNDLIDMEVNSIRKLGLLAGVSHELRNSLNGILGPIELLEDSILTNDGKELIEIIKRSTKNATSMLDDILSFNQLTNKLNINKKNIDLKLFFSNLSILIKGLPYYNNHKFKIISELTDNNTELICDIDPIRINQIILNLVSNSLKFSDYDSQITIKWNIYNNPKKALNKLNMIKKQYERHISSSYYDYSTESSILDISVIDEGKGISKRFLNKIFMPFTQENNPQQIEGFGLGLSIVRGIILLLKGNISCFTGSSGTYFNVLIPIDLLYREYNKNTNDIKINKKHIFIVDDSLINLKIIEKMIKKEVKEDIIIDIFLNAESALEKLEEYEKKDYNIDLLITDVYMNGLSGIELLKEVRKKETFNSLPVVLCTGSTSYANISKELNSFFLLKPITKTSISEIIDKTINKQKIINK